jgi:hypothetical protein
MLPFHKGLLLLSSEILRYIFVLIINPVCAPKASNYFFFILNIIHTIPFTGPSPQFLHSKQLVPV